MKASDIPAKFSVPFAKSAGASYIRTIPTTTAMTGQASYTAGFPPETFVNPTAGGIPPDGRDFNGLGLATTSAIQWLQAGGGLPFDASFSSAIGGYPMGARIPSATVTGLTWVSTIDNNTTNPDTTPSTNWVYAGLQKMLPFFDFTAGGKTFTVPSGVYFLRGRLSGSGGTGASATTAGVGGGGGGGAGGFEFWAQVTPGQQFAYTIAAAASGVSGSGIPGNAGYASGIAFGGVTYLANGGAAAGAATGTSQGGAGGSGGNATSSAANPAGFSFFPFNGGFGTDGIGVVSGQITGDGGAGGTSIFGGGGRGGSNGGQSSGVWGFGTGGGYSVSGTSTPASTAGLLIVEYN